MATAQLQAAFVEPSYPHLCGCHNGLGGTALLRCTRQNSQLLDELGRSGLRCRVDSAQGRSAESFAAICERV